jgi:hypothetical protein
MACPISVARRIVTISAFSGWRQRQTTGALDEGEGVIMRRAASPGFPQGRVPVENQIRT